MNCLIFHCVCVYVIALYSSALTFHSSPLLAWRMLDQSHEGSHNFVWIIATVSLIALTFRILLISLFLHYTVSIMNSWTLTLINRMRWRTYSFLQCLLLGSNVWSIFDCHSAWELPLEFGRQESMGAKHLAVCRLVSNNGNFSHLKYQ